MESKAGCTCRGRVVLDEPEVLQLDETQREPKALCEHLRPVGAAAGVEPRVSRSFGNWAEWTSLIA